MVKSWVRHSKTRTLVLSTERVTRQGAVFSVHSCGLLMLLWQSVQAGLSTGGQAASLSCCRQDPPGHSPATGQKPQPGLCCSRTQGPCAPAGAWSGPWQHCPGRPAGRLPAACCATLSALVLPALSSSADTHTRKPSQTQMHTHTESVSLSVKDSVRTMQRC